MLAAERQREILSRLRATGAVRVAELATALAVTEETVRRDLDKLARAGRIVRTHGGAVAADGDRREVPFAIRSTVHLEAKRAIARAALPYIEEGDVIALDASSTVLELARAMPDRVITVVTNCIAAASLLAPKPAVRVLSTGGQLDGTTLSHVGPIAVHTLEQFNIQKAFLSCQGLDLDRGVSVTAGEQAGIKRRMLELAAEGFLLIDSSKLRVRAVEFFAPVEEIGTVITDSRADEEFVSALRDRGVRVEIAPVGVEEPV